MLKKEKNAPLFNVTQLFFKEAWFLFLPTIFIAGVIVFDFQNYGSTLYAEYIKQVSRAHNFYWVDNYYPLGYPVLLKGLFFILKDYLLAGKILSAISSFIVVYCAGKIAGAIYTNRAGFISQLILLSSPFFFGLSATEGTDMPAVAPCFISLYFLLKNNVGRSRSIALSGLFMGFAYLIRYPNLLFMSLVVLWLLFSGKDIKANLRLSAIYISAFLLASAIQLIPSALETGNPFYNNASQNIYFAVYGAENYGANWETYQGTFLQLIENDFLRFAHHYFDQLRYGLIFLHKFLIAAFLGLVLSLFNQNITSDSKNKIVLLLFLPISLLLVFSSEFTDPRHLLPIIPLLCISTGILGDVIFERLNLLLNRFARVNWMNYIAALLVGIFIFSFAQKATKRGHTRIIKLNKEISDVLLNNGMTSPQEVLCASSDLYFHYSKTMDRYDNFFWGRNNIAKDKDMNSLKFEYLLLSEGYRFVIFEEEGLRYLPNLWLMFNREKTPEYWEMIFKNPGLVIYKIPHDTLEKVDMDHFKDMGVIYFGFHQPEQWNSRTYRWSSKEGVIGVRSNETIELDIHVSHPDIEKNPVILSIFLNKELFDMVTFNNTGDIKKKYYIPASSKIMQKLSLIVSRTWNPYISRINNDNRDLGIAVSEIKLLDKMPVKGIGFYDWETWGGGEIPGWPDKYQERFRWTGMRASMSVQNKSNEGLTFFLYAANPDINKNSLRVKITGVNGFIREEIFTEKKWKKVVLSSDVIKDAKILTIHADRTWNPKADRISDDSRDLGIIVAIPER